MKDYFTAFPWLVLTSVLEENHPPLLPPPHTHTADKKTFAGSSTFNDSAEIASLEAADGECVSAARLPGSPRRLGLLPGPYQISASDAIR